MPTETVAQKLKAYHQSLKAPSDEPPKICTTPTLPNTRCPGICDEIDPRKCPARILEARKP